MNERVAQGEERAKTRRVELREFVVHDVDENYEPPEKPHLRVQFIGPDLLSLSIETRDYNAKKGTVTYTRLQQIIVDYEPFANGLIASTNSWGEKPA